VRCPGSSDDCARAAPPAAVRARALTQLMMSAYLLLLQYF
jgi:hypothetical protein